MWRTGVTAGAAFAFTRTKFNHPLHPVVVQMSKKLTVQEALAVLRSRCIETPSGCWEYQGNRNRLGYGQFTFHGKRWMVHRFMRWHMKGPFDLTLDLCHECDNPPCANPEHTWPGNPKANAADCVQKGRHYKAVRTHCPKGHPYVVHGRPHSRNPNWRVCNACERARQRIAAGWPEDLAYSLDVVPAEERGRLRYGSRIGRMTYRSKAGPANKKKTHCRRGHPLEGENIYPKPGGGRQCKICHDAAVEAWIARGKVPLRTPTGTPTS